MKITSNKTRKPLLILITRTRNYAWVTRAFLEGNKRWADYIIITDQMSTDGTREMCAEYENVILVDDLDMEFKENTGFKMALAKGREIAAEKDAIYFALDIDEVMPANWMQTDDGKRILSSKPGDMFAIAWGNIQPGNVKYLDERDHWDGKYTVFHDNGMEWQDSSIEFHAPHLPYSSWEVDPYPVKDFPILHFGWYNPTWNKYKAIYHQMLDVHQKRSKSIISFYRTYHSARKTIWQYFLPKKKVVLKDIDNQWLFQDFDLFSLIDMSSEPIFANYIRELLRADGVEKYLCLDIWNEDMLCITGLKKDPRPFKWRLFHAYEWFTQPYKKLLVVRAIDKVLKKVVKYQ